MNYNDENKTKETTIFEDDEKSDNSTSSNDRIKRKASTTRPNHKRKIKLKKKQCSIWIREK